MRMHLFSMPLLCFVLATMAQEQENRKQVSETEGVKDELDLIAEDNAVAGNENEKSNPPEEAADAPKDPCENFHCGAGKQCDIGEDKKPNCVCIKQCPLVSEEGRKVCSNHNETWESDCELYRMRCLCEANEAECTKDEYKHAHVDYYGVCRDIEPCTAEEMEDFPRRMRDWLFNVMKDMADRNELEEDYKVMEKEAEQNLEHKWVNAVIWKFCDLDSHPHDRSVSRHELFPIRAPLLAMEHCIAPFLDGCDANDDHQITFEEWGKCLGLEEAEIQDKCPK